MEVKPKISRYLILIVVFIIGLLAIGVYWLLSSEELTRYAINTAIERFIPNDKLNVKLGKIDGCLLNGIKIDKLELKHIKPNFEARLNDIYLKPTYESNFSKGSVLINGSIGSLESSGTLKINASIASIPPFLGYECFAALPSNIKIKNFDIGKIRIYPYGNNDLEFVSDSVQLKKEETSDILRVETEVSTNWKSKLLAKVKFNGGYEQAKNKLNGNIKINIAKQCVVSELSLLKGKKGLEVSGYIASDTLIDFQPLSQWLGCFWQLDYPYSLSGKLYCQGSWLYNSEIGFLGNLKGKYDKLEISVMGLFISLLELNGNWQIFDGCLSLSDTGSKLVNFPASLNGKIENIATPNRKWNISFVSNSLPLDKITSSLPWVVKYTNGIPDLEGVATISASLVGNRPTVNAVTELENLSQKGKDYSETKITGKAVYNLPEIGSGTINANFIASNKGGLPQIFKKFSRNFYSNENKNKETTMFNYSIKGSFEDKIRLTGSLKTCDEKSFETSGELIDDMFILNIFAKDNAFYNANNITPIDLLLMR